MTDSPFAEPAPRPPGAPAPSILIVEDDAALAEEMVAALDDYGLPCRVASDWEAALAAVVAARPDLVILDQRLGRFDAVAALPALRRLTTAPVLVLTGNRAETDRIVALETGADDFLLKPISGRELVARVRAHLRRAALPPEMTTPAAPAAPAPAAAAPGLALAAPGWRLLLAERQLLRPDGEPVPLTGAEFALIALLAASPGQPVDRDRLCRQVLQRPWRPTDRSLDNLVLRIRHKLGPGGERCIVAVRTQGYAFTAFPG